jgi:hypothetical protein
VQGAGVRLAPPAPEVAIRFAGHRFFVDVRMRSNPDACRAVSAQVVAFSTADWSNRALPDGPSAGFTPLVDDQAAVMLREPFAELPPYEVVVVVYGARGLPSAQVRRQAPYSGDYCLRHHPRQQCVLAAHARARHCMLGDLPPSRCLPWSWSPPRRAAPIRSVTLTTLTRGFREQVKHGLLVESPLNETRLTHLSCRARNARFVCTATYARHSDEGFMRVRYTLTGHNQQEGCWYVLRSDTIQPPETHPPSPLAGRIPTENDLTGCTTKPQP